MGKVFEKYDMSLTEDIIEKVSARIEKEEQRIENLEDSSAFNMVLLSKKYDDWFLDPIVGLVVPGVGDLLSSAAMLPGLYVSLFKLHSFRLTLAIFCCGMIDMLVGAVPMLGDLVDAFYKSNKIACRLIIGYVEGDPETMKEINRRAIWGVVTLGVIAMLFYFMYEAIMNLYHWFASLL